MLSFGQINDVVLEWYILLIENEGNEASASGYIVTIELENHFEVAPLFFGNLEAVGRLMKQVCIQRTDSRCSFYRFQITSTSTTLNNSGLEHMAFAGFQSQGR